MKKARSSILVLLVALVMCLCAACGETTPPVKPTCEGLAFNEFAIEMGLGEGRYLECTSMSDAPIEYESSNPNKVRVSTGGYVSAVGVGAATITARLETGETATCDVTVHDTDAPTIPEGEYIKPVYAGAKINPTVPTGKLAAYSVGGALRMEYDAIAAQAAANGGDASWSNNFEQKLPTQYDYSRSTKLCFWAKADRTTMIYVKIYCKSQNDCATEATVGIGTTWQMYELDINMRELLPFATEVFYHVPRPEQVPEIAGGYVDVVGVWFDGDAEPKKPLSEVFDPDTYELVYEQPLLEATAMGDLMTKRNEKLDVQFKEDNQGKKYVEIVNSGYNFWQDIYWQVTETYGGEGYIVAYEFYGTAGAVVQGRLCANSGDFYSTVKTLTFTEEGTQFMLFEADNFVKDGAFQLAPTKLDNGVKSATVQIRSIKVMRPPQQEEGN